MYLPPSREARVCEYACGLHQLCRTRGARTERESVGARVRGRVLRIATARERCAQGPKVSLRMNGRPSRT